MPKAGDIVDGYKFKGGNPNDQANWEPVSTGPGIGEVVDGYKFKGGNPNDQASWELDAPAIEQEMHPDLSMKDRLVVKNFANSPESSLAYLKQQYPGMEVSQYNGQIIVKKPGEQQYRVLDPDTGFFSTDFLRDGGDVAYDLASGVVENVATATGGALGFASPVPGGTVMGAMGAGGATSAATEALRQKLGQMAGIPQEVNMGDVGMSAGIGALSPALLGVDKLPGSKAVAKEGFERASEGLLKRGGIGAVSLATGIENDTLREGFKRLGSIKQFEETGVTDFVDATHDEIKDTIFSAKSQIGNEIGATIKASGEKIDLTGAQAKLKKLINEYEGKIKELKTPGMEEKLANVKSAYEEVFGTDAPAVMKKVNTGMVDEFGKPIVREVEEKAAKKVATEVSAEAAFELQQQLADMADLHKTNTGILSRFTGKGVGDKRLANAATDANKEVAKSLETALDKAGRTTGTLSELKSKYKELSRLQTDIAPKFSTPEKTYNTLRTMNGKNKQYFYEKIKHMDDVLQTNVADKAKDLEVYSLFSRAATDAPSSKGVTSTSRTIPLAALGGGIGYTLGGPLGAAAGAVVGSKAASPAAVRMGMEALTPINKAAKKLPNVPKQSIWNLMYNQESAER